MKVTSDDLIVILLNYANSAINIYVPNCLQRPIVWQKPILLFKKKKTCTSSKSSRFHYFCLKFCKCLSLSNDYVLADNFYFLLDCKIFKRT